jgi:hypothetical protein
MPLKTPPSHHFLGVLLLSLWVYAGPLFAHGFGERYDLPVPMQWVILAACGIVAASFFITPFFKPKAKQPISPFNLDLDASRKAFHAPLLRAWHQRLALGLSCALLLLTWSCAAFGIEDPLMNFAPTFIWIVWWLGVSFACMVFGNFWPQIDPWMGFHLFAKYVTEHLTTHANKPHLKATDTTFLKWPESLGRWPACATLLLWCGLEIVYPIAAMPHRLGVFIVLYSLYMWLGMFFFGPAQWRAHADGFSLYFELIGQARQMILTTFSPLFKQDKPKTVVGRNSAPLKNTTHHSKSPLSTVALVIAMFTSVLFDGLHAGPAWLVFEKFSSHLPFLKHDVNGFITGALGLVLLWSSLLMVYTLMCSLTLRLFFALPHYKRFQVQLNFSTLGLAYSFLASLLPIAMAYLIAHNFSSLFIQGQNIIALASDPFGWGWNLLGTAHFYPDIALIDAKLTWYVATFSIVIGHVISVLMAHRVACQYSEELHGLCFNAMLEDPTLEFEVTTIKPWILNMPMTLVMIGFTAISLSIIAEPLTNSLSG